MNLYFISFKRFSVTNRGRVKGGNNKGKRINRNTI